MTSGDCSTVAVETALLAPPDGVDQLVGAHASRVLSLASSPTTPGRARDHGTTGFSAIRVGLAGVARGDGGTPPPAPGTGAIPVLHAARTTGRWRGFWRVGKQSSRRSLGHPWPPGRMPGSLAGRDARRHEPPPAAFSNRTELVGFAPRSPTSLTLLRIAPPRANCGRCLGGTSLRVPGRTK